MKISEKGKKLIKYFEGSKNSAYMDIGGRWTIGVGHLLTKDSPIHNMLGADIKYSHMTINTDELNTLFEIDLSKFEKENSYNNLLQHQYDAILSFIFNFGTSKYRKYTLKALIDKNADNTTIIHWWLKYHFDSGKPSKGLQKRRAIEAAIYTDDIEQTIKIATKLYGSIPEKTIRNKYKEYFHG